MNEEETVEERLRHQFPAILWDEPVSIRIVGDTTIDVWVCRFCIALHGFRAWEAVGEQRPTFVFDDYQLALDHVRSEHGKE